MIKQSKNKLQFYCDGCGDLVTDIDAFSGFDINDFTEVNFDVTCSRCSLPH